MHKKIEAEGKLKGGEDANLYVKLQVKYKKYKEAINEKKYRNNNKQTNKNDKKLDLED